MAIAAGTIFAAGAQDFRTSYFLDNFVYNYRINPALHDNDGTSVFVGMLANNIAATSNTNVGLSTFLFPYDGGLVTGLNKNIPADTFLAGLPEGLCNLSLNFNENLFSFGHIGTKSAFNFELNLRGDVAAFIPSEIFRYLKVGSEDGVYNMDGLGLSAKSYLEAALGYSRTFKDIMNLTVGLRAKAILGIANTNLDMDRLSASSNSQIISLTANGGLMAATGPVGMGVDKDGFIDFTDISYRGLKPAGYGAGIDLGVSLEPIENLTVSAAILDLGFIQWNYNLEGVIDNFHEEYTGGDYEKMAEDLGDVFTQLLAKDVDNKVREKLHIGLNAGARYKMPFYDKLSVGILASYRDNGAKVDATREIRAGATFTPHRSLGLTANYGIGNYGQTVGFAASLRLPGLNIYAGTDRWFFNVTPNFIPIDPLFTTVNAGVVLAFGHRKK